MVIFFFFQCDRGGPDGCAEAPWSSETAETSSQLTQERQTHQKVCIYNKKLYILDTIGAEESILIQCIVHTRVVYTYTWDVLHVYRKDSIMHARVVHLEHKRAEESVLTSEVAMHARVVLGMRKGVLFRGVLSSGVSL